MIICIDFDGTCVTHNFPDVGYDIGAVPVLKQLVEKGHQLVLFTMRSDIENPTSNDSGIIKLSGNFLSDAVSWFYDHNIPLYGVQINPEQTSWTTSPKAYGHLYIDDAALGCPLAFDSSLSNRPFVDWDAVSLLLIKNGYL